jgi:hypothetical protein
VADHAAVSSFTPRFNSEKRRQWDLKQKMQKIESSFEFVISHDTRAAGRFLAQSFNPKPTDTRIVESNLATLTKVKSDLENLKTILIENSQACFRNGELKSLMTLSYAHRKK